MKKYLKSVILILALSLTVAAFTFTSFAEGESAVTSSFTVYGSDGNPTGVEGETFSDLRAAAEELADGDTMT